MAAVGRSGSTAEPSAAAAAAGGTAAGGTAELGSTVCMRQDKREARQSAVARSAVESCAAAGMGNTVARVAWAANTIRLAVVPVAAAVFADCAAIAAVAIATVAIAAVAIAMAAIAMAAIAEAVGYAAIAMVAIATVAAMVASVVGAPVAAQVVPPAGPAAAAVPSAVVLVAVPVAERLAAVAARVATVSVAAALSAVELTAQLAALVPLAVVVIGCSIVWSAASSCPPAPSTSFSHAPNANPRWRILQKRMWHLCVTAVRIYRRRCVGEGLIH